jgi:hypothetical protein
MNDAIQKMIDGGRWKPIADAPHGDVCLLVKHNDQFIDHGVSKAERSRRGWTCTDVRHYEVDIDNVTHFRSLPDDRLANALEVAVGALEIINEHATYHDGAIGRIASEAIKEIEAIAEGTS